MFNRIKINGQEFTIETIEFNDEVDSYIVYKNGRKLFQVETFDEVISRLEYGQYIKS